MTKKEYQKPMMEVFEANVEQQILASSITSVTSTGLDEELDYDSDNNSGNVWGDAW